MDDKRPDDAGGFDADDDAYVIEDTGGSVEEIEQEMRETAQEAAEGPPPDAPALAEENQQLKDRVLRTLADFENYRKRTDREKAEFFRYAVSGVLKDILPVLDNFDRALEHAEEGDEFHKGVLLIYKQLFEVLEKHGLRQIEESGVVFDPNIHEAVVREEDDSVPSHTVVAVLQKGYFVHDRLLRPALVKVAVGGPDRTS
ncbi:MAG TPA: nucleotide exchange factor GrpE [Thermoanaerobaculia bacterium]